MKLEIVNHDRAPEERVQVLRDVFAFVSPRLGLDKIEGTVKVDFGSFRNPFTELFAFTHGFDGATQPEIGPGNTFSVTVFDTGDKHEPRKDLCYVFAHELVHVKDIADGRLRDGGPDTAIWEGEEYSVRAMRHDVRPWEAKAIRLGFQFMEEYHATRTRQVPSPAYSAY